MNLTWHIVRKDLRALRWPLLVWIGLITAKLVTGIVILNTDGAGDDQLFAMLDGLAKLLSGFECLGVVLVAALIQEDLLVGTTAFWTTRPISGGRLLAAKLLGLALIFVVLPVLVTLPWWLGCRLSFEGIALAAAETAVLHGLVVLFGLLLAVVTDGLGRFLLWLLALMATIPLSAALIGYHFSKHNVVLQAEVATTRVAVVAGVALLGLAAIVVHQFCTRRLWRSVSMIGLLGALMVTIALWWPWSWHIESHWRNFLARQAEKAWPVGAKPPGLTFVADQARLVRAPNALPGRPVRLVVNYHVDGVPANQTLLPGVGNYTLRWTDGSTDQGWSWFRNGQNLYSVITGKTLGLPAQEAGAPDSQVHQIIEANAAARLEKEPAAFILQGRFALVETETTTKVPLVPGNRIVDGDTGERIGSVEKDGEELRVTFVRHHPALVATYLAETGNYVLGAGRGLAGTPAQYLLVNRAQNFVDGGWKQVVRTSRVAGVELSWDTRTYRALKANGSGKLRWEAIKALDEAELTRVTFRSRGNFAHEFKIDPLVLIAPASN